MLKYNKEWLNNNLGIIILSKKDNFTYFEAQLFKKNLISFENIFKGGEGKD